jgi:hypothetical protein
VDAALAPPTAGVVVAGLGLELRLFAPGRAPRQRETILWSACWLLFAVAVAVGIALAGGPASEWTTVYLIERMTIQRVEHVGNVADVPAAATPFFVELGLKLQGEWPAFRPSHSTTSAHSAPDVRLGVGRASAKRSRLVRALEDNAGFARDVLLQRCLRGRKYLQRASSASAHGTTSGQVGRSSVLRGLAGRAGFLRRFQVESRAGYTRDGRRPAVVCA